jgi:cytoskeletal protein CcmA (bactofilin family)
MFNTKNIIPTSNTHNAITTGTYIIGEIKTKEDIRIDGKIEGNIECAGKVIIGPNAEITGNIYCINAELMGKIRGNIEVKETVTLKSQVYFAGEIITKYLDIESGAVFNGGCTMKGETVADHRQPIINRPQPVEDDDYQPAIDD